MALKVSKYLISTLFLVFSLMILACDSETEIEATDQNMVNESQNISDLPPGIPSYPYIFSGKFFVNGKPGPENSVIISKLGELDSPEVITGYGIFKDLIIGPKSTEDVKNNIEFFLLKGEKMIKADEEIAFDIVRNITNVDIELNFNE